MGSKGRFVSNRIKEGEREGGKEERKEEGKGERRRGEKYGHEKIESNFLTSPESCHTPATNWLSLCKSLKSSRFSSPHL